MHNINQYLESTYLKTPKQAGLTENQTLEKITQLTQEAIEHEFCGVVFRNQYLKVAHQIIKQNKATTKLIAVVDFPEGNGGLVKKISEAQTAINNGANELDFVFDYKAYLSNQKEKAFYEWLECTKFIIQRNKTIKWIIEVAALNQEQIAELCSKMSDLARNNFQPTQLQNIFVKSSTGFYPTNNQAPNGATPQAIKIMLKHASPLPIKAAGGIRNQQQAQQYIALGVSRLGTSAALAIALDKEVNNQY